MRIVNCIINTTVTPTVNVGTSEIIPEGINMSESVNVSGEVIIEVIHNEETTIISNSNLVVNLGLDALAAKFSGKNDDVYVGLRNIKLGAGVTPPNANDTGIEILAVDNISGTENYPSGEVQNVLQVTASYVSSVAFMLTESCLYNIKNGAPTGEELFSRATFPPYQVEIEDLINITWNVAYNR